MGFLRALTLGVLSFLLVVQAASVAAAAPPAYGTAGAFAAYNGEGGFIPYFSGVVGNITYTVTSVHANGSMSLRIFENITAGTDLIPFIANFTIIDSVDNPRVFPAVSLSNLSSGHIEFQNVSATFAQNNTASVPAGTFHTMEFTGTGANSTQVHFWFDRNTGLMVEESGGTSVVELEASNVAVPYGPPASSSGEVAYELVFVLAFAIGGGLFLYLRYYYTRSAAAKSAASGKK